MAGTLSDLQHALAENTDHMGVYISMADEHPMMGIWQKQKPKEVEGRGLIWYSPAQVRGRGRSKQIAEGGDYGPGGTHKEIRPYITPKLFDLTVEFTLHETQAMGGRHKDSNQLSTAQIIQKELDLEKGRMFRRFLGRDDGVVARADTAGTNSSTLNSSIPVLALPGDFVRAYTGTAEERDLGVSDANFGTTAVVVDNVVWDDDTYEGKIEFAATQSWTDDAVIVYAEHTSARAAINGIFANIDSVKDSSFTGYDADDSAAYDHVDTYMSLDRASNSWLNANTLNVSSAPLQLYHISRAVGKARQYGASTEQLVLIINPETYGKFAETYEGMMSRGEQLTLPGGTYRVPILTGAGAGQIGVVETYGCPKSIALLVDPSTFYRIFDIVGWDTDGGSRGVLKAQTASSGQGYAAKKVGNYNFFDGSACCFSNRSTILYGIATTA